MIDDAIAVHGAYRVFRSALAAMLKPKRKKLVLKANDLNTYLRRDIGLGPVHEQRRFHDLRF